MGEEAKEDLQASSILAKKRRPLFWTLPIPESISGPDQGLGLGLLSLCYCDNNRAVRVPLGSLSQWLLQTLWGCGQALPFGCGFWLCHWASSSLLASSSSTWSIESLGLDDG